MDRLYCSYGKLDSDVLEDIAQKAVAFYAMKTDGRLRGDEEQRSRRGR